jgi:predicted component of type VI protein secretion system
MSVKYILNDLRPRTFVTSCAKIRYTALVGRIRKKKFPRFPPPVDVYAHKHLIAVFRRVRKIVKAIISFVMSARSIRPSVRASVFLEQLASHWKDLDET